jgi:hypothetical protein
MAITGSFEDFSLSELLQFLEQGQKTGLLYIKFHLEEDINSETQTYYIWLHQGRVVAASDRLDNKGLTLMIAQRGWISERVISRLVQISPNSLNTPLGLSLKTQGLLQPEQLKQLFNSQILRQICPLFEIKNAVFKFNATLTLPSAEMTGLSMSGTEVILMGLRSLRNWSALAEKLPDPTSSLSSLIAQQPQVRLDAQEWQVWEFVNGHISLKNIANHLRIPVETVQQIAFRLIAIGLVEEQFILETFSTFTLEESSLPEKVTDIVPEFSQKPTVTQSFLKSLMGFLRSK